MYFDELSKIRVLQPEVLTQTEELKEECKQFVDSKLNNTSVTFTRWIENLRNQKYLILFNAH